AGRTPAGILSLGVGGTPEKAMLLAKRAMMEPINMHELISIGPQSPIDELRLDIYHKVNALGIGAQGLGGLTTVLDVKIQDYPTHAASKPIAMIPNCAATRHIHFTLDGSGTPELPVPDLNIWPDIQQDSGHTAQKVNLDSLDKTQIASWKPGDTLLLSGKILTGRDAAHKRIIDLLNKGQPLPAGVDFTNRFIYYVGPVDAVRDEVVGPAGPTTADRMDKFTEQMLAQTGLIGMIGKAERGPEGIKAIKKHGAVYLIATGGAAFLVSKAIRSAKVIAFEEMGMEAIYEFEVEDMPVTVAVDSKGESIHITGPQHWRQQIAGIPIKTG
ncbi:FumA C-terminus/TtdB family hydratase beta subunit, partial [Kaarinaea lacus]